MKNLMGVVKIVDIEVAKGVQQAKAALAEVEPKHNTRGQSW